MVRFASDDEEVDTLHLSDYSEKELRKCWYTGQEKERMELRRLGLLFRLKYGKSEKPNSTFRGLEQLTREGQAKMTAKISACVTAVLDEQDRQWETGIDDWDAIASASRKTSLSCLARALVTAEADRKDSKEFSLVANQSPRTKSKKKRAGKKTKRPSVDPPQTLSLSTCPLPSQLPDSESPYISSRGLTLEKDHRLVLRRLPSERTLSTIAMDHDDIFPVLAPVARQSQSSGRKSAKTTKPCRGRTFWPKSLRAKSNHNL